MNTRTASEGMWLRKGDTFVKAISSCGDISAWVEVTDAEKVAWEDAHKDDTTTEDTTESENSALLQYVNDKTDSSYNELGDAVIDLVNN